MIEIPKGYRFAVYKELEPGKGTDGHGWRGAEEAGRVVLSAPQRAR